MYSVHVAAVCTKKRIMFPDRIKIETAYIALCFDFSSLDIVISSRFLKEYVVVSKTMREAFMITW